jgi:tetratricopeptide (TPR) repeat protein
VTLASQLAHDWGHILVSAGRFEDAAARFEAALAGYTQTRRADLAVEVLRDLAEARITLGHLDRADEALRRALAIPVARDLRPSMARLASAQADYNRAESLISDAIVEALPQSDSALLAGYTLELGRVLARLARYDEAAQSIERSRHFFEMAHRPSGQIEALVTLGQIRMAQGNSVSAQTALHAALDVAMMFGTPSEAVQAAGVLVHVHQIRAKRARRGDRVFRQNTLREANFTRAILAGMGLDEHVVALDQVIEDISAGEAKPLWY